MAPNISLVGGQRADARRYSVSLRNGATGSSTTCTVPFSRPANASVSGARWRDSGRKAHIRRRALPRAEPFVCSSNGSVVVCLMVALILLRAPHPFH
jgi:hypothetical protein